MAQKIRWSSKAASNFEEICKSIPQFPKAGRIVPEYGDENIREKIYENYRIVYRIKGQIVEIAAINHSSKPLENVI